MSQTSNAPLRLTPLGGVGEFGMNCMLLESASLRVLIDCGVMFPDPDQHPGVDLLIPRFDALRASLAPSGHAVDALLLTHGHEDHIGGVPWLVMALQAMGETRRLPIYGTPFTMALVRRKLEEHGLLGAVAMHTVKVGATYSVGALRVETVPVNHSIPDAVALVIETPVGRVLHTGDWRIDQTPVRERRIDLARFAALGAEGILVMLGDSTNAGTPGHTPSEAVVAEQLIDVLDLAPGRVIVTLFSSNVWRLQSVIDAAHETNRRVILAGRSMRNNFAAAIELGHVRLPSPDIVVEMSALDSMSPGEVVIVAAGSQGEPQSTLTRMAQGEHNVLDVHPDDTIVYSVRHIPGNEKRISDVVDAIYHKGASVLEPSQRKPLHTSGHAYAEEMKTLLNLVRPRYLVPVHGGFRQLAEHANLGRSLGLDAIAIENGDQLRFGTNGALEVARDAVPTGLQYVVGNALELVDDETLRQRRQIGFGGFLIAEVVLSRDGRILAAPQLFDFGVTSRPDILEAAREAARAAVLEAVDRSDAEEVGELLRLAVRRTLRKALDRKPLVLPRVTILDVRPADG